MERRPEREALKQIRETASNEADSVRWSIWGPEMTVAGFYGDVGTNSGNLGDREGWAALLGWTYSFGSLGRIKAAEAREEQASIGAERFHY